MRIELAGWVSTGLRCPDMEISLLKDGHPARVSFIQMPNGTGKTTTLTMLTAALSGEATTWSREGVIALQRAGETRSEGSFKVELQVDERPLTIKLKLDFEVGRVHYLTTAPGSGGVVKGFQPPPSVKRFLNSKFLRLFVFDGEFAGRLLNSKKTEAERAIDALCQLYLLDEIDGLAQASWESETRRSARSEQSLSKYQTEAKGLKSRLIDLRRARSKAATHFEQWKTKITDFKKDIAERMRQAEGLNQQYKKTVVAERKANEEVVESVAESLRIIQCPHFLHSTFRKSLKDLKENLDQLKLPENTSSQFFFELASAEQCICGRSLNDETRTFLREQADAYLGEASSGFVNTLKQDIRIHILEPEETGTIPELGSTLRQLSEHVQIAKQTTSEVRLVKQEKIDQGDESLREKEDLLRTAEDEAKKLGVFLDDLNDQNSPNCLTILEKQLEVAEKQIAKITDTLVLRAQTTRLQKIVRKAKLSARDNIRVSLVKECNERLLTILAQDPLEITKIEKSLHLKGQTGASVGQTLSVGYVFLMSVLNRGQHDFPLVVDSPAGALDKDRRREIGLLIPTLCHQFVAFTISTEQKHFVSAIEQNCQSISYFTTFRKTKGTESLLANLPDSGVTDGANGDGVQSLYSNG